MMSDLFAQLGEHLENSIRIQMQFYPDDWSDADKREMAIRHLFGANGAFTHEAGLTDIRHITATKVGG